MKWLNDLLRLTRSPETSKNTLKNRLNLVLAYDRAQMAPGNIEALRSDLLTVVRRYFPEDERRGAARIDVEQRGDTVVLIANITLQAKS